MDKIIADIDFEFRRHKGLTERALGQLDDAEFFRRPAAHVNAVAVIVKHLAGNLNSRFTDFLTADGDKASRDRDSEFVITETDTRSNLMAAWERGWKALADTFAQLKPAALDKSITIRGEAHTVQQALLRALTHTLYHVGQITFIVRLLKPDGAYLTIAPGKSKEHKGKYLK